MLIVYYVIYREILAFETCPPDVNEILKFNVKCETPFKKFLEDEKRDHMTLFFPHLS